MHVAGILPLGKRTSKHGHMVVVMTENIFKALLGTLLGTMKILKDQFRLHVLLFMLRL